MIHLGAAMASILANASNDDQIVFHIVTDSDSGMVNEIIQALRTIKDFEHFVHFLDPGWIKRINSVERLEKDLAANAFRKNNPISVMTYSRLLLGRILDNVDRVIYLDCDLVVLGSLKNLWGTDIEDNIIGAVEEPIENELDKKLSVKRYFNSGVMLINLKEWRNKGIEEECLGLDEGVLSRTAVFDQSILNYVFRNSGVFSLNPIFNYCPAWKSFYDDLLFEYEPAPVIVHFLGDAKPWSFDIWYTEQDYFETYWKYRNAISLGDKKPGLVISRKEILRYLSRHPREILDLFQRIKSWSPFVNVIFR